MPSPRKDKDKDKNKEPPSQPAANEGHPILTAAMYGRLDELRQIAISEPDSVRRKEQDGWTIAHWAARRGFINMLGFIADRAPGLLLSQDNNGAGPGHYAASYGHDGILSLMAERDPAALMVQDNEGNSPAHDATKHNRLITLKVLVESCPSLIYGSNAKGQRPVDVAERDEIKKFLKDSEKASMVPAVQLQNLTREARLLNAQNAVLALYCRNYWATNGSEATQIKVAEESTEHHMVHVEFARTMARAAVSAIQRVEDRPRLDRFLAARDAARQRHGSKWDDETMERWLFFMESDGDSVERAVTSMSGAFRNRSGVFAARVAGYVMQIEGVTDAAKYGNGIYWAREATYVDDLLQGSASDPLSQRLLLASLTPASAARGGLKAMVMARVVVGAVMPGRPNLKPPYIKLKNGKQREVDTLVDSTDEPLTFVIPTEERVYPAYVISYGS